MGSAERFGHFEISRGADGHPIELSRSGEEVVFLAFDVRMLRIVELHILKGGQRLSALEKGAALERVARAEEFSSNGLLRILFHGEDNDSVYYSTSLNDGESLEAYIARRGALPTATAFSLTLNLLEDLISLQRAPEILAGVGLAGLQIAILEDTFLQLRILDYGLSSPHREENLPSSIQRLTAEVCNMIFLLLIGKSYAGDDCDRLPILAGMPTALRATIRATLVNPAMAPTSLERLRDDVREGLSVSTRDVGLRSARRHLVATDLMVPKSALRDVLLHDVPLEKLLGGRLTLEQNLDVRRYPFTILASDARTEAPLTAHLLPPRRIVSQEHYDAVPAQVWRFNPEKHPNILRSLSVWASPDLTFLTEERGQGFPLSRLIAERVYFNPSEVLILLRQIRQGVTQARDCGVEKLDLHPSNMVLRIAGTLHAREMEKLLQKRLDAWPKFHVLLRPHVTMRNLYEPLLLRIDHEGTEEPVPAPEFRNASFIALAAYLLSGEQQAKRQPQLPDSIPAPLVDYVLDSLERSRRRNKAPAMDDFLAEFERRASLPETSESAAGEVYVLPQRKGAGAYREVVQTEPMESVGSISDFDEDQPMPYLPETAMPAPVPRAVTNRPLFRPSPMKPLSLAPKQNRTLWYWVAGVVVLGILLIFWLRPRTAEGKTAELKTAPAAQTSWQGDTDMPADSSSEEVRRALVPSDEEKAAFKKKQSSATRMAQGSHATGEPVEDLRAATGSGNLVGNVLWAALFHN